MRKSVLCLCILMVGGLNSWENTDKKWNELMSKKHEFVMMTNNFPFNDFQEISAIFTEDEIVGKDQHEKAGAGDEHIKPAITDKVSVQWLFTKKPPDLGGIMWRDSLYQ